MSASKLAMCCVYLLDKYRVVGAGCEEDVTVGDEADDSPNTCDDDDDSLALYHNVHGHQDPH